MRGRAVRTDLDVAVRGAGASVPRRFSLDDLDPGPARRAAWCCSSSVAAVRLSVRSGLPSLLHLPRHRPGPRRGRASASSFDDQQLPRCSGYAALVLILAEGGLTTRWSGIRRSVAPAAVLSTVGRRRVGLVVGGRGRTSCSAVAGRSRCSSAPCSPPPTPPPCSRCCAGCRCPGGSPGCSRPSRASTTRPVVLLVTALAAGLAPGATPHPLVAARRHRGRSSSRSAPLIGLAVGWVGARLLRLVASASSAPVRHRRHRAGRPRLRRRRRRCTPPASSRCYLAALVLGNLRLPHRPAVLGFATALGWLAQIGLFVLLGLLAHPDRFLDVLVPALVVGLVLLLLARPLSVLVSVPAVPDVVARPGVPVVGRAARRRAGRARHRARHRGRAGRRRGSSTSSSCSSSSSRSCRRRRCRGWRAGSGWPRPTTRSTSAVETTPLERARRRAARDRQSGPGSRLAGVRVFELRLPEGANVTLVVREGESFVPRDERRAAPRRPAARRHAGAVRDARRAAAARGEPRRPPRRLALSSPAPTGPADGRRHRPSAGAAVGSADAGTARSLARLSLGDAVAVRSVVRRSRRARAGAPHLAAGGPRADVRLRVHRVRPPFRGRAVVQRRLPHRVPRVRGAPAQGLQRGRHRLQGRRLLPHRLALRVVGDRRVGDQRLRARRRTSRSDSRVVGEVLGLVRLLGSSSSGSSTGASTARGVVHILELTHRMPVGGA